MIAKNLYINYFFFLFAMKIMHLEEYNLNHFPKQNKNYIDTNILLIQIFRIPVYLQTNI